MDSSLKTVKILSLDGGGMKGYFTATFLNRFCLDAGIAPNRLYDEFNIITGTSIGAIQALGYAYGKTPEEMRQFFATKGSSIFAYNSILPLSAYKFSVIMGLPTYPSTFYAQAPLQAALEEVFGTTMKLSDLSGKVIIPSWNTHEDGVRGAMEQGTDLRKYYAHFEYNHGFVFYSLGYSFFPQVADILLHYGH